MSDHDDTKNPPELPENRREARKRELEKRLRKENADKPDEKIPAKEEDGDEAALMDLDAFFGEAGIPPAEEGSASAGVAPASEFDGQHQPTGKSTDEFGEALGERSEGGNGPDEADISVEGFDTVPSRGDDADPTLMMDADVVSAALKAAGVSDGAAGSADPEDDSDPTVMLDADAVAAALDAARKSGEPSEEGEEEDDADPTMMVDVEAVAEALSVEEEEPLEATMMLDAEQAVEVIEAVEGEAFDATKMLDSVDALPDPETVLPSDALELVAEDVTRMDVSALDGEAGDIAWAEPVEDEEVLSLDAPRDDGQTDPASADDGVTDATIVRDSFDEAIGKREQRAAITQAVLTVVEGPGKGQRFLIGDGVTYVGRSRECQVVLQDPSTSRKHFRIEADGGQYSLIDLGSENGTEVNGMRSDRIELAQDTYIVVGRTRLHFGDLSAPPGAKSSERIGGQKGGAGRLIAIICSLTVILGGITFVVGDFVGWWNVLGLSQQTSSSGEDVAGNDLEPTSTPPIAVDAEDASTASEDTGAEAGQDTATASEDTAKASDDTEELKTPEDDTAEKPPETDAGAAEQKDVAETEAADSAAQAETTVQEDTGPVADAAEPDVKASDDAGVVVQADVDAGGLGDTKVAAQDDADAKPVEDSGTTVVVVADAATPADTGTVAEDVAGAADAEVKMTAAKALDQAKKLVAERKIEEAFAMLGAAIRLKAPFKQISEVQKVIKAAQKDERTVAIQRQALTQNKFAQVIKLAAKIGVKSVFAADSKALVAKASAGVREQQVTKAQKLHKAGETKDALALVEAVLKEEPTHAGALALKKKLKEKKVPDPIPPKADPAEMAKAAKKWVTDFIGAVLSKDDKKAAKSLFLTRNCLLVPGKMRKDCVEDSSLYPKQLKRLRTLLGGSVVDVIAEPKPVKNKALWGRLNVWEVEVSIKTAAQPKKTLITVVLVSEDTYRIVYPVERTVRVAKLNTGRGFRMYNSGDFSGAAAYFQRASRDVKLADTERRRASNYSRNINKFAGVYRSGVAAANSGRPVGAISQLTKALGFDRRVNRHYQRILKGKLAPMHTRVARSAFKQAGREAEAARAARRALQLDRGQTTARSILQQLDGRVNALIRQAAVAKDGGRIGRAKRILRKVLVVLKYIRKGDRRIGKAKALLKQLK